MEKLMYRVSNELRTREYEENGMTVITTEQEQCGCFYYFDDIQNAAKAAMEFGTGFIPVAYCPITPKSDDWYGSEVQ